jgi:hypothetical protein
MRKYRKDKSEIKKGLISQSALLADENTHIFSDNFQL